MSHLRYRDDAYYHFNETKPEREEDEDASYDERPLSCELDPRLDEQPEEETHDADDF